MMNRIPREISAAIEPGLCCGRLIGEDSGVGACELCVQICPEVFEKPVEDRCARVRADADLAGHAEQVFRAARECLVNAIQVATGTESF